MSKEWNAANRERMAATQKRRHLKCLKLLIEHKESLGCSFCGYNKCGAALDWHHIEANKERRITVRTYFTALGEAERAKCILLCSNCHRELHFKERYQKEDETN